jgi:hypothetical protein
MRFCHSVVCAGPVQPVSRTVTFNHLEKPRLAVVNIRLRLFYPSRFRPSCSCRCGWRRPR